MLNKPYAQLGVQPQSTIPAVGQVVNVDEAKFHDFASPAMVKQAYAVTLTAVTIGDVLELGIDEMGEKVSRTALTDVEATEAAAVAVLWNANTQLRGYGEAVAVGAVLTITANVTGYNVEFTNSLPAVMVPALTAGSKGTDFEAGRPIFFTSGLPSQTPPAGTDATNIVDRFVGITPRGYDEQGTGSEAYKQRAPRRVTTMVRGRIGVRDGATAKYRDPLYIGSAGANIGKFFNAAGADRVLMPASFGHWFGPHEILLRYGC